MASVFRVPNDVNTDSIPSPAIPHPFAVEHNDRQQRSSSQVPPSATSAAPIPAPGSVDPTPTHVAPLPGSAASPVAYSHIVEAQEDVPPPTRPPTAESSPNIIATSAPNTDNKVVNVLVANNNTTASATDHVPSAHAVALADVIKPNAKPYDSARNRFRHDEHPELEEESPADTYSLLIQTLFIVGCIIAAKICMKRYIPWKGYTDLSEISLVFTGLFFILGQMFSNVNADLKEAEKMPMDVVASLDQLEDSFILCSAKVSDKVNLLDAQHLLCEFARTWHEMLLGENGKTYGDCLNCLSDIVDLTREWDKKGAANTGAIITVVDKVRRIIGRATIIKRTDVLPAARALLHFFVLMSCALLFLAQYKTEVGLCVVMACVMTVCIFMARIISNMDDPFNIKPKNQCMKWIKGHMAAVQVFPVVEYTRRMERRMEKEFEGMRALQMKQAAILAPATK